MFSVKMAMTPKENSVGFAVVVGILVLDETSAVKPPSRPKRRNGLGFGFLKVIRQDRWHVKAITAKGSFTV